MKLALILAVSVFVAGCAVPLPAKYGPNHTSKWISLETKERSVCMDENGKVYTCLSAKK